MRVVYGVGSCRTLWNIQVSHSYNADASCKLERDEPMPNIWICTGEPTHTYCMISKIENRSNSSTPKRRVRLVFRIMADPGENEERNEISPKDTAFEKGRSRWACRRGEVSIQQPLNLRTRQRSETSHAYLD
jgi:hypothetical protein